MNIDLASPDEALSLFGSQDRHLRMIRERFDVTIVARNGAIKLSGDPEAVRGAGEVLTALLARVRRGEAIGPRDVERALAEGAPGGPAAVEVVADDGAGGVPEPIRASSVAERERERRGSGSGERAGAAAPGGAGGVGNGRGAGGAGGAGVGSLGAWRARTAGQQQYLDLIERNEIVFAIGPAGTGKTFLATLKAVEKLKNGEVQKIVLCRPAVEAGERLGFLPGDFHAKVNPYLRPLYDALNEMLDVETVRKLIERETIEIVPLAYMRGRTLNRAFIILDEAQNTSPAQMKMFLTRMGEGSRIVVTGDVTQVDLPEGKLSGLVHIQRILRPMPGIAFHFMTGADIVRHKLVWHILQSYDRAERDEAAGERRRET